MLELNFNGEFGWELLKSIPYAYNLYINKIPIKTISCKDTKCLYYFSNFHEERHLKRIPMSGNFWKGPLPFTSIHRSQIPEQKYWTPPPYKETYKDKIEIKKPILIISNKYNIEWDREPVNYISKKILIEIINFLKLKYNIYYNRATTIIHDNSKILDLEEKEEIKNLGALILEEEYEKYKEEFTFNTFQMMLFASCDKFISVQGGTSILSSYFGGKNLILAKRGQELACKSYNWYKLLSGCDVKVLNNQEQIKNEIKCFI